MGDEKRFQPDRPAYVVDDLSYAGRAYYAGEVFPAKGQTLTERELYTMWNGERIVFGEPPAVLAEAAAARREADRKASKTPAKGTSTAPPPAGS